MTTAAARAAATRKNNYLLKHCPLLAPLFWTTAIQEQERLDQKHRAAEIYLKRLKEFDREMAKNAASLRTQVAELVSDLELAELDKRLKIYPNSPEYAADFWRRQFKERTKNP